MISVHTIHVYTHTHVTIILYQSKHVATQSKIKTRNRLKDSRDLELQPAGRVASGASSARAPEKEVHLLRKLRRTLAEEVGKARGELKCGGQGSAHWCTQVKVLQVILCSLKQLQ